MTLVGPDHVAVLGHGGELEPNCSGGDVVQEQVADKLTLHSFKRNL